MKEGRNVVVFFGYKSNESNVVDTVQTVGEMTLRVTQFTVLGMASGCINTLHIYIYYLK